MIVRIHFMDGDRINADVSTLEDIKELFNEEVRFIRYNMLDGCITIYDDGHYTMSRYK